MHVAYAVVVLAIAEEHDGRALIERVYEDARAAGAGHVYWQTHETNRTAMHLYDAVATQSGFLVYYKRL